MTEEKEKIEELIPQSSGFDVSLSEDSTFVPDSLLASSFIVASAS
jgi:hypothetical protein